MEINKEELVNSADTELLDSQIDQITDSFIEEHFLDNDEAEQLEVLVAKSMKLGELYERKKWQEKATPEGFVLVKKELSRKSIRLGLRVLQETDDIEKVFSAMIEAQEQSHD